MYDFLLQIRENSFYEPYKGNHFFEMGDKEKLLSESSWYHFEGLTNDRNRYFFADLNHIIWVYGDVFLRDGYKAKDGYKLTLTEVLNDIKNNQNIHLKYKGNYCIFLIDIIKRSISIINNQLGLTHVYYYYDSDKMIVSNNLNHFKHLKLDYNFTTIYQKTLFTYELDENTFFKGVKRVKPGEVIHYENNTTRKSFGLSVIDLFEPINYEKFNVEKYIHLFNSSVKQKAQLNECFNVSFTGGFDGRTIVSSLLKQDMSICAYSFGKRNGENTRVPISISNDIGINYSPVYLDDEYVENYVTDAKKVIYFSDGMSFNERANYIYAFRKLAKNSRYVLSGLIGGETLRPVHLRTDYINENYYQLFYLGNFKIIDDFLENKFLNNLFIPHDNNCMKEIRDIVSLKHDRIIKLKNQKNGFLYYLIDLMETGFRMYYGTEIHFERQFCSNLTPFYDIDLLEYLLSTDYVEIFKQAFKPGKIHRWSGQKIYAEIIKHNYRKLNLYSVDRGYPPEYLLNPLKLLLIPYLYYKRKYNRHKYSDFDENNWSKLFLADFIETDYKNEPVFSQKALKDKAKSNLMEGKHSSEFNRLISLQTWFNQ